METWNVVFIIIIKRMAKCADVAHIILTIYSMHMILDVLHNSEIFDVFTNNRLPTVFSFVSLIFKNTLTTSSFVEIIIFGRNIFGFFLLL